MGCPGVSGKREEAAEVEEGWPGVSGKREEAAAEAAEEE